MQEMLNGNKSMLDSFPNGVYKYYMSFYDAEDSNISGMTFEFIIRIHFNSFDLK